MSEPCAITTCKRTSRALCYCCQQGLCLQHLKEHNDLLISQLNSLVDEINTIGIRLKAIDLENKTIHCRQKLEQWRIDSYKRIDDIFNEKCEEINQRLNEKIKKQKEEIDQIQSKVTALIHDEEVSRQDINLLTSTIERVDDEIKKIQCSSYDIAIQPFTVHDDLISIQESIMQEFDLSKLVTPCKTINYTNGSWISLASNHKFLLIHQAPSLCLINEELT